MVRPARAPRQEAVHETRERILHAALEAFAEMGFDGASTREIASRAGVPVGLLQYHYGSKAKLWQAAVDEACGELRNELAGSLIGSIEPREQLSLLLGTLVRFCGAHPEFVRLMHDEGKRRGPRMRWLVDRYVKPMFERLVPVIERCQERGVLPADISPVHFGYALVGASDGIFHQAEECRRVTGLDPLEPDEIEAHVRAVEFLFLGAPKEEDLR